MSRLTSAVKDGRRQAANRPAGRSLIKKKARRSPGFFTMVL
jgi:hypothetical protein